MLRGLYPRESQIAQVPLAFLCQKLLKLLNRLHANLVVHVINASEARLRCYCHQNVSKGLIFQSIVVQVDLTNGYISDLILFYQSADITDIFDRL